MRICEHGIPQGGVCPACEGAIVARRKKKAPLEAEIRATCDDLADFLVEKNRAYGNSAVEPINIFGKHLNSLAQIDVRIDDKLNRLAKGNEYPGDDTVKDLAGYLVLRMIVVNQGHNDDVG